MNDSRLSWDSYFAALADMASTRSTCSRAHVGCVLVKDRRIVATGFNGAPSGETHCSHIDHGSFGFTEGTHLIDGIEHCAVSVHAEANAVADCARRGVSCEGATAYITKTPCENCRKLLVSAGVSEIKAP